VRLLRSPYVWLTLACVGSLLLFIDKAFHIDDPLFLWTARQIQSRPLDFYRFNVNWYWSEMPMASVTKNPPLAAYYIAGITSLFDWSEPVLHLAFLVWPVGVILGTYQLATAFGTRPTLAALATLWTPVFLVSSSNLMCDAMMLCFWMWAVVFWERGLRQDRLVPLCVSAILISLSALTKYFGMTLIPLLLVYSLADRMAALRNNASRLHDLLPGVQRWVLALLIPVLVLGIYQWGTHVVYGRGLLMDAAEYATQFRGQFNQQTQQWYHKTLVGLAFAGGCAFSVLCFAPVLWSRDGLLVGTGLAGLFVWTASFIDRIGVYPLRDESGVRWPLVIQLGVCATVGVGVLALAVADLARHKDAKSLLLFLWVVGTFAFATFLNWTINGRSFLPMIPALGILIMRRIDARFADRRVTIPRIAWPLIPAAAIALAVAWADYRFANSARAAAALIRAQFESRSQTTWFQGHWGFQYYMQEHGARILDRDRSPVAAGDLLLLPRFNTYVGMDPNSNPTLARLGARPVTTVELVACPWLATMNRETGAGFYSTEGFGPLPFVFGAVPPEQYYVVEFTPHTPSK
jgi:hypothetical protein